MGSKSSKLLKILFKIKALLALKSASTRLYTIKFTHIKSTFLPRSHKDTKENDKKKIKIYFNFVI